MVEHFTSDAFARSFGQRAQQLVWLLGAGASASAGVPTAADMIANFKARRFCAQMNIPLSEVDISDPLWEQRITSYFDGSHGFPPAGDPGEYSVAFEAAYPLASDRRSYIENAVKRGAPSFGHRILASCISEGLIRCMFTTNFDALVERATAVTDDLLPPDRQAHLTVSALDSVERGERCIRENAWPLLVKLHGDYRSEHLKNTAQELQNKDDRLRRVLISGLTRFGLVVVGYSGRDDSIMDVLDEAVALDGAFPSGLWWVARPCATLLPRVVSLLEQAVSSGIEVHVVDSENFDELAGDLEREVDLSDPLRQHVHSVRSPPLAEPVKLPKSIAKTFPVVSCSALELIEIPNEARLVILDKPLTTPEARKLIREANIWATVVSDGYKLAIFGPDDDIARVFAPNGGRLNGTIRLNLAERSTDRGLVYAAIVRSIARRKPLRPVMRRGGHSLIVQPPGCDLPKEVAIRHQELLKDLRNAYKVPITGKVPHIGHSFAEGIRVSIEEWDSRWWLVYEPYTWVDLQPEDFNSLPRQTRRPLDITSHEPNLKVVAADWRRERWARRYNRQWNKILVAWANLIAPEQETKLSAHYFRSQGVNAEFRVSSTMAWSSSAAAQVGYN